MGWTKRQFVSQAFDEIGVSDYEFDLQPEQIQKALNKLDAFMAHLDGLGVRLGYPLGQPGTSNLDDDTTVPSWANQAIYMNLAVIIAPSIGKKVSAVLLVEAKKSLRQIKLRFVIPDPIKVPANMPVGAGNKPWRTSTPFTPNPPDNIQSGDNEILDFE